MTSLHEKAALQRQLIAQLATSLRGLSTTANYVAGRVENFDFEQLIRVGLRWKEIEGIIQQLDQLHGAQSKEEGRGFQRTTGGS